MRTDVMWIPTPDGERLTATLYFPDGDGPWATLLEALPYRQHDVTESYRTSYERYADAGFAVCRLDLRGTGSSSGVLPDEYADVERDDLRRVIEWLSTRPWSTGKVGMFGTSYSGFNSLHLAMEGVPALAAVAATYATDDRYTDDVHYMGGALRQLDLVDYPLYMVAMNALPPVPAVFGDGWRDEWRRRVEATPAWLVEWLEHPDDGPTWRRGSIRLGPDGAGYERLGVPVLLIAGWADGYRNNTFRTVAHLGRRGVPWRLLAGPWVHQSPASAHPGPNVDADAVMLAWFDEHLRGGPGPAGAPGQVYVRAPAVYPRPDLREQPGVWRAFDRWPAEGAHTVTLTGERARRRVGVPGATLRVHGDVGWTAWNSCGGALPWGQPLEQTPDNARSLCFDWPVEHRAEVLGHAVARLRLRSDRPYAHVSVKLCDVGPDGTSALVTRGFRVLQPAPGAWLHVAVELEATTWTLVPGRHLRLAVAGTDWPNCWPPPGPHTLEVGDVELDVPVVDGLPEAAPLPAGTGVPADIADGVTWTITHDVLAATTVATTRYGGSYDGAYGARVVDDYRGEIGVSVDDPGNAWVRATSTYDITWPEATVRTEATLDAHSDRTSFAARVRLKVWDGRDPFAERTWEVHRRR